MKYIKKYKLVIYSIVIISTIIILLVNINDKQKTKDILIQRKPIIEQEIPVANNLPTIDFEALRKKYNNKDIIGAIRIVDDSFEEIIFKSKDSKYYLTHNYSGSKKNGEIFIDSKIDIDGNSLKIINGEGSNKTKKFKEYYNDEYYKKHKYLEIETDKSIYKYEILMLYEGNINYDNFNIEDIVEKSSYKYNLNYTEEDEFMVLCLNIDGKKISIISKKVN